MRAIFLTLLVVASWLNPLHADAQQTFCGKTVEGWIKVFRDKKRTEVSRRQAVFALGCFGPQAMAAVPDLIDAIRHGHFKGEAVEALVRIGAGAEVTVPLLIEQFVKQGCVHHTGQGTIGYNPYLEDTLARIGGPAVPALVDVLNGPDKEMRVCAAAVLARIGPAARGAIPPLLRAIEHPDTNRVAQTLSHYAVRALGRIGPEAKAAVPALNGLLTKESGNPFDVVIALDGIGEPPVPKLLNSLLDDGDQFVTAYLAWLGPKARQAAPALRRALTDKRPQVRISAAVALAHIEPSAREAIPVLIEALDHLNDGALDGVDVLMALARLGPKANAATPVLIGLVRKGPDDPDVLKALVQIDPEGKECVPVLIATLKHKDYEVVDVAANCLGLLGPRAKDAVPALAVAVTRDFNKVFYTGDPQVSAATALRRIGPQARSAIPSLIGALKYRHVVRSGPIGGGEENRDCSAAAAAAQVLGFFRAEAKAAIPALIEAVQAREKDDANWFVRQSAALALAHIGPDAKVAVPALRNVIKENGVNIQNLPEALIALYRLAPDGKALAERWLEQRAIVRVGRAREMEFALEGRAMVLGAMGRTSVESDWLTRRWLESMDAMIAFGHPIDGDPADDQESWFEKIGRFGVAGRLAIPRLNEFRKYPNPWVRMWAAEALERIVPHPPVKAE